GRPAHLLPEQLGVAPPRRAEHGALRRVGPGPEIRRGPDEGREPAAQHQRRRRVHARLREPPMTACTRRALGPALAALACGLAAGCTRAPPLTVVRGTLTKGTQPVAEVMIQFAPDDAGPDAKVAYGHADAAGAFVMKTLPHGTGVVPGTYRITLQP